MEKRLDRLLAWKLSHEGNRKFQRHLAGHLDEILTFLYKPAIEAANWPSEQALRPAVVLHFFYRINMRIRARMEMPDTAPRTAMMVL